MKLFKWNLIDDIDKMCLENGLIQKLKKEKKIIEEQYWNLYLQNEKLKEENINLKNHQKIQIRDINNNLKELEARWYE